jgi:flagellar hook assembly protein FlgD
VVWGWVSDEDVVEMPVLNELQANYPNPFNPTTTIGFAVASEGEVSIVVYNLKGQRVRGLISGVYRAGSHSVTWDGTDDAGRAVSSGVYFYRMVAGEYSEIKRMMLLK